ncbi:putative indole-3-pyruvate monooxygenase YUCCA10 [Hibiscus syriacus]|uniref:indole-3-pyruvate monooxygenase n=1 Tax=Hibiscus syriacus TaxID=106335 RepID=A0A6A2YFH5_HIBSY|nr:probable indole-3-pyruvate monooxygenase YUCCA10 [Hibiscus syriacus]KAE8672254.1 putative indole-3-pyruvate monooxygenase YUCCA10 [Hibiscus syriacus]
MQEQQSPVIIVGAGPSGLATAASLNLNSIPYIILEREDCFASLWKKYSYDRLHLHLYKQFCELPHLPFPDSYPRFISKEQFISYLDDYVSRFKITPLYRRCVESAEFDEATEKWIVKARNLDSNEDEEFKGRFLAVASGEASNPHTPEIEGLKSFPGLVLHSTQFRNGKAFRDKNVLVVGSGNSGMEIALDLANHGAKTSIVVRSLVHILSREMVYLGLNLLKYVPVNVVDSLMIMLSKLVYGDLSKYGIIRPTEGPFFMKVAYGKYPVFDVGTYSKIKSQEIQVLPAISSIRGDEVVFDNGKAHAFDTIVFCTGFKRSTHLWLKGDDYLLNGDGIPKPSFPNHWKGNNGLYCVGLSRRGLYGASSDAQNIANDIKKSLLK